MGIQSKIAIVLMALVASSPLAFSQNSASGPAPEPLSATADGSVTHPRPHQQHQQWNHDGGWRNGGGWGGQHWQRREHRPFMLAGLVRNPYFRDRVGITPAQALEIRTKTLNFRKNQIRDRANLQVGRLELKDLLSADNPDRNAINQKLEEISAIKLATVKSAIDFHLDMRAALTPDQQQKLRQMRQEFFRHRGFGDRGPEGARSNPNSPAPAGL